MDQEVIENGRGTPVEVDGWSVAQLGNHGIILSCDDLQIRLSRANVEKFFDLVIDEKIDNVQTDDGFWIEVDADAEDGDVIITPLYKSDKIKNPYPDGVVMDEKALRDIGITLEDSPEPEVPELPVEVPPVEEPAGEENEEEIVEEGVKMAYRRSGKKLKRGFRVTSGIRKGRVVADIKTAHKPRAKASTRAKLRLARKKKKVVRILKSKRTRRKSLSKRLKRMNSK